MKHMALSFTAICFCFVFLFSVDAQQSKRQQRSQQKVSKSRQNEKRLPADSTGEKAGKTKDPQTVLNKTEQAEVTETQPTIREGGLIRSVRWERNDGVTISGLGNTITAPKESVFLWLRIEVPKDASLPMVLELSNVSASLGETGRYKVVGLTPLPDSNPPEVLFMLEPIPQQGGSSVTTMTMSYEGTDLSFRFNSFAETAKLSVKKVPTKFLLYFLVPAQEGTFQILGLGSKTLNNIVRTFRVQV